MGRLPGVSSSLRGRRLKDPDFCWLLPGDLRSGRPPPPQFSATWRPRPQSTQTESSVWQHNHRRDAHHLCMFSWLEAHPRGGVTWRVAARRGPGATPHHDCVLSPPGHRLPFPDPAAFLACFMIMAPFLSLSVGVQRGPSFAEATQGCARSALSRGPTRQGAPPLCCRNPGRVSPAEGSAGPPATQLTGPRGSLLLASPARLRRRPPRPLTALTSERGPGHFHPECTTVSRLVCEQRQSQTGPGREEKGVLVSTRPLTSCPVPHRGPPAPSVNRWLEQVSSGGVSTSGLQKLQEECVVQPIARPAPLTARWEGSSPDREESCTEISGRGSSPPVLPHWWDAACHSRCPARPLPSLANQVVPPPSQGRSPQQSGRPRGLVAGHRWGHWEENSAVFPLPRRPVEPGPPSPWPEGAFPGRGKEANGREEDQGGAEAPEAGQGLWSYPSAWLASLCFQNEGGAALGVRVTTVAGGTVSGR